MLNQSLSALMDGELDEREAAVLLERIRHDPELRDAWGRQHYLRIAMCERPPREIDGGFSDHIMSRIAAEEADLSSRTGRRPLLFRRRAGIHAGTLRRGWHRPVTGLAVAASVAAVAVLVMDQGTMTATVMPGTAATASVTASAPHAERVARSEAAAQSDSATVMAVAAQPSETPAQTLPVTEKSGGESGAVAGSRTTVATVGSTVDGAAIKPVAVSQGGSARTEAADVAGADLEQLISTGKSPLSWDAASLARDQQLRSLLFSHGSGGDAQTESPSALLGYMHMTSENAATTTAAATATKKEAAQQH